MEEKKGDKENSETTKPKDKELNFRNLKVYLMILSSIKKGVNPEKIASKLSVPIQNLNKYVSRLKRFNYVRKVGYGAWELTKDGEEFLNLLRTKQLLKKGTTKPLSLGTRENSKVNIHALTVKMPVLSGVLDFEEKGYKQQEIRGWVPQYLRLSAPLGLTLKNNNNKSVSVYLWSREIPRTFDVNALVIKCVLFAYNKLKEEYGVVLDVLNSQVKVLHLSVRNEDLDLVFNKGESFEVVLNRSVKKILPADEEQPAKAWIDSSPYLGVETNDLDYKENLIMMPERINKVMSFLPELGKEVRNNSDEIVKVSRIVVDNQVGFSNLLNKLGEQIDSHMDLINEYRAENVAWRKGLEERSQPFFRKLWKKLRGSK